MPTTRKPFITCNSIAALDDSCFVGQAYQVLTEDMTLDSGHTHVSVSVLGKMPVIVTVPPDPDAGIPEELVFTSEITAKIDLMSYTLARTTDPIPVRLLESKRQQECIYGLLKQAVRCKYFGNDKDINRYDKFPVATEEEQEPLVEMLYDLLTSWNPPGSLDANDAQPKSPFSNS